MDPVLLEKLENCQTLPSLPAIAHEVIELSKRHDTSTSHIADILEQDPALAAKVVALSNSAANISVRSIDSVKDAITRIGLDMTMTLALSFSFAKAMYNAQANTMDHAAYWKRSLVSAVTGRTLATKLGLAKPDRFFLAGLIQDIGMLALNEIESERYGVIFHSAADHQELVNFERSEFFTDHAEVGSWLLSHWGMPEFYIDLIKNSHRPCNRLSDAEHQILHFTSCLSELWTLNNRPGLMRSIVNQSHQCRFLKNSEIKQVVDSVTQELPALNDIFETDIQTVFSATDLIEEAKQQLVERNMRLVQQLQQAKNEVAEIRAGQEQLKDQLKKDLLTGVFNRAYIESISQESFRKARDMQHPLTVMFLDIDHFKQVNDDYGHQAGDQALKHFSRVLLKVTHNKAYVGRYGGEEFVIIMPRVTTDIGLTLAARIRALLKKHPVRIAQEQLLPICASIGIATYQPGLHEFDCAESLLNAADKTMYQAKKSGRDKALAFESE